TYLRYGNGTETEYSYEAERRRLQNMTAKSNTTYGSSVNRTFINNNYSYDILSNVLSVENTAALPITGQIGGSVLYEYGYDDLNRLEKATALFTGRNAQDSGYEQQQYSLTMEYDNLHNIVSKEQLHQKAPGQTGGIFTDIPATTYRLDYAYEANNKPHAPRTIIDKPYANSTGNDIKTKTYNYDANGNMITLTQKTGESETVEKLRTNLWDEENRLRAVDITPDAEGIRPIAIYTYDAGGERILKHSNTSVSIYLNGKKVADTIQVDATLYPSGITVFRPSFGGEGGGSYTKHYFAGTQRVSSKIGTTENLGDYLYDWFTQGTGGPVDVIGSSFGVLENAEQGVVQVCNELGIDPPTYESDPVFIPVASFIHGGNEIEQYYFHPDHLGSTSYITNLLGEVSQHMEYFAFGETFVEEHRSSNNSPYKFNGKELDEETGLYYYGARYYDPRISIWLSVDPLVSDGTFLTGRHNGGFYNSFNQNSYIYCYQNPVILIDPNGKQTTNKSLNSTLKNLSESNPNDDIYLLNNVGIPSGNVVTARNQHHWKDKTYQMTKIYSGKHGGGSQFEVYNNNEITIGYARNLPASSYQSASYDISFEKINGNGSDQLTQESLDNLSKVASSIKKSGQTIEINSIVNLTRNGQAI